MGGKFKRAPFLALSPELFDQQLFSKEITRHVERNRRDGVDAYIHFLSELTPDQKQGVSFLNFGRDNLAQLDLLRRKELEKAFSSPFDKVEQLILANCEVSANEAKHLVTACRNMKKLNLSRSEWQLESECYLDRELFRGFSFPFLSQLHSVDLSGRLIRDSELIALASKCRDNESGSSKLRCLQIKSCRSLTAEGIKQALSFLTSLEVLDLGALHPTVGGLASIFSACPQLKTLQFSCTNETDIRELQQSLPLLLSLKCLDLRGSFDIDKALTALAQQPQTFEELSLIDNYSLTKAVLTEATSKLPNLKKLIIWKSKGLFLRDEALSKVSSLRPDLKVTFLQQP